MSASTSTGGRRQLSAENANSVSTPTPRSGAASTTRRTASAPARWPAVRASPRRIAQRPLPSMMSATCSGASALDPRLVCITKSARKNFSGGREALHEPPARRRRRARGGGGIGDDTLEHREVVDEALAPGGREPAGRLRAVVAESLRDLHQAGFLEDTQVTAQVAVGQPAELLQRPERETLRVRCEGGEDRQAGALVDHAVEPLVREAPGSMRRSSRRHRRPR